ncbi:unnamed protein product [Sphagnum jensenii]|uniref:CCT domain-containing protein n=1 Tax=Sphagnum jensenii TaxID=128206 RepID=A0ABP0X096_9BRYO
MAGVSELLFRHDTADCFAEACLNHEQSGSVMDPFTEDDDLEEFFRGAFTNFAEIGKEGFGLSKSNDEVEFKNIKAEEKLYPPPPPPQQVEISMLPTHNPYTNGDSRLYTELNGVVPGLTSPSSSAVSVNGPNSPTNGASENSNGLSLEHTQRTTSFGPQLFNGPEFFDASGYFQQGDQSNSAGMMHVSPGVKCFPPSSLPSLLSPLMPPPAPPQVNGNGVSTYYSSPHQDMPSPSLGGLRGLPWASLQIDTSSAPLNVDYEDPREVMHFSNLQFNGGGVNLQLQPRSNRRSSMLRSHSSHTLGQDQPVMHPLSPQSESSFSSRSLQLEFTGQVTSPLSELQSQQSDLQDIARATYMVPPSMRRAQSTGDLQRSTVIQVGGGNLSPMYGDTKRVGRFTLEERRQLLQRFQQKRTQRNFNKKIKYACRKSLADKRPRVRGRFARNDDSTEHPSHMNGHKIEDDDEVDTAMGEEDEFLMHQSSSGDLSDLLELPVKLERFEP